MPASLSAGFLARERSASQPCAFVLGTGINGLTVARSLSRTGALVVGVDGSPNFPTTDSSAWSAVALLGAEFEDHRLIDWLLTEGARCARRPVLIVTTDEQVKLCAADDGRLGTVFAFEQSSPGDVALLMSKQLFGERARAEGWPMPEIRPVTSATELEHVATTVAYPVILKPQVKNREFRKGSPAKAFRCDSAAELRSAYASFSALEPDAIVQDWVVGGDHDIRYSFHYFAADGRELVRFEGRKIRQWIPECGSSASATRCDDEIVGELSATMLRACGAVGLCSVEYKRDRRSGRYVIMEPTIGRPNLQIGSAIANGIDLIAVAYAHLAGLPVPRQIPTARRATWMIVPSDLKSARHYIAAGELTWPQWFDSLSFPVVPSVFRLNDTGIMTAFVQKAVGALGRRIKRRLTR